MIKEMSMTEIPVWEKALHDKFFELPEELAIELAALEPSNYLRPSIEVIRRLQDEFLNPNEKPECITNEDYFEYYISTLSFFDTVNIPREPELDKKLEENVDLIYSLGFALAKTSINGYELTILRQVYDCRGRWMQMTGLFKTIGLT